MQCNATHSIERNEEIGNCFRKLLIKECAVEPIFQQRISFEVEVRTFVLCTWLQLKLQLLHS